MIEVHDYNLTLVLYETISEVLFVLLSSLTLIYVDIINPSSQIR